MKKKEKKKREKKRFLRFLRCFFNVWGVAAGRLLPSSGGGWYQPILRGDSALPEAKNLRKPLKKGKNIPFQCIFVERQRTSSIFLIEAIIKVNKKIKLY